MSAAIAVQSRMARLAMQLSRDKSDTLLLIGATMLVLAPHVTHLPLWVSLLCTTTLAWRALITFRGTRMPPSSLLLPLALIAVGGIYLTFKTILGRDAGVAMAILLVAFKMLEMRAKRDLFVVIFLNFFLLLTNFFYSQGIGTGIMMVAAIVALLSAQLTFQYTGAVPPLAQRLRLGATILAVGAPLAVALFFLFPRVQGPLWGMPGDASSGRTGLSNTMSPGNIANLAQSTEIAFRVQFQGPPPAQHLLYWRGLVLDDFDGRTWSHAYRRWPERDAALGRGDVRATANYEVTLEPHNGRWLLALDMPAGVPLVPDVGADLTPDRELRAREPVSRRVRYSAGSTLEYRLEGGSTLASSERWLALPRGFNPRAMQAGLDLQREAAPETRVRKVLEMFRRESFSYTLQPPLLGVNSVDDFLYQSRAGFCEHYSSAFVFLMRAADVPARVVAGYQGGEINPVDGFMEVRQSDAHAWAEVWLGERGWVRVDPTAAVAPERVQRPLARVTTSNPTLDKLINIEIDRDSWLAQLRFRVGAVNNGWNQWVLNYDKESRRNFMAWLEEAFGNWRALAGLALACCLIVVARARRLRREIDPVDALYSALSEQLSKLGLRRAADEGPNDYARRIAEQSLPPEKKEAILHFLHLYSAHKYGAAAPQADLAATLKRLLNTAQ
jgi:transglutaminase-like putative cysteine protease